MIDHSGSEQNPLSMQEMHVSVAPGQQGSPEGGTARDVTYHRAVGPRRLPAARRLVEAAAPDDPHAGARFLEVARLNGMDLSCFWYSTAGDAKDVRQVCLCIPGAGRTGMFFTSEPRGSSEAAELGGLIDHVCRQLDDVILAQTLLAEHEEGALEAFLAGGFQRIGRLSYLRLPMPGSRDAVPDADMPPGFTCSNWRTGEDPVLIEALERSYEGTLDCPELCGLRPMADVLESHRATGEFHARNWWLLRRGEEVLGAMLFNVLKAQDSVELVYMGVAPETRGLGVASAMLSAGLKSLAGRPESTVTCAVDHRNEPARRLYARFGFKESAERTACIRSLQGRNPKV